MLSTTTIPRAEGIRGIPIISCDAVVTNNTVRVDGMTVTRNNVSRSTDVDCVWVGGGTNVLTNNHGGTQTPSGAFD